MQKRKVNKWEKVKNAYQGELKLNQSDNECKFFQIYVIDTI